MDTDYPTYRSHYRPRTAAGRLAVWSFLAVMALAQPPLVFWLADRPTPWIAGVPFLYAYLFVIYVALIGILLWTDRRRI